MTAGILAQRERKLDWKEKQTKIHRMIHESDDLGKDLYNRKAFGIEWMKIEKTKQTNKDDF